MTTMLQLRGTCPACFGEFQLHDDAGKTIVGRHGWQEIGGRQVGVYDRVTHDGSCFGADWAPFELSPEGTWAFLREVVFPRALREQAWLDKLQTSTPPLPVTEWSDEKREQVQVILTPTNEKGKRILYGSSLGPTTAYERAHKNETERTTRLLGAIKDDGTRLYDAAANWKLCPLKDGTPKGPTVHFKNEGARLPYCGSRSYGLHTTTSENAVTCSRCLKGLETEKKEQEAREALQRDADTLTAYLKANGRKTKSDLKKGLGWDTKRVNRAVDRAERPWFDGKTQPGTIRSVNNYPKPESFEAVP